MVLAARISTVAIDERELGTCAARMLYEMRTGKRAIDNNEQVVFSVTLLPGETTGAVHEQVGRRF